MKDEWQILVMSLDIEDGNYSIHATARCVGQCAEDEIWNMCFAISYEDGDPDPASYIIHWKSGICHSLAQIEEAILSELEPLI